MALRPNPGPTSGPIPGPTPADLVRFGRAGIDPGPARIWTAEGVSAFEAEVFSALGLEPAGARRVLDAGVSALAYAVVAHRDRIDPLDIDAVLRRIDTAVRRGIAPECATPSVEPRAAESWWAGVVSSAMDPPLPIEVQLGDLAEMLGASASKLSIMRRSQAGFPTPLTASRSPRFALAAVLDSAVFETQSGSIPPSLMARMAVRTLAERTVVETSVIETGDARWNGLRRDVARTVAAIGAIEFESGRRRRVERAVSDGDRDAVALLDPPAQLDRTLWRSLGESVLAWMLGVGSRRPVHAGEVLDELLMVIDEVAPPVTVATGPALARLMVDVADLRPGHRVLDPGCGIGELLVAAAARAGYTGSYHGIEIDADLAEVARLRLEARALDHEIVCGSWFNDDDSRQHCYDTVLVDPPLSGGVDEWVDGAMAALAPGGRVVIVVRQSDLRPSGSIARRLADGHLEAEIQIPYRARAEGRMPKYVVVLTHDGGDDRLPVREDLSAARITTSGGRVRTGPTSEQSVDRLKLDTSRLLAALRDRRTPPPRTPEEPPLTSRDRGVRTRRRDASAPDEPLEVELALRLISALRHRDRDDDRNDDDRDVDGDDGAGDDQEVVRVLLDALERFVRDGT